MIVQDFVELHHPYSRYVIGARVITCSDISLNDVFVESVIKYRWYGCRKIVRRRGEFFKKFLGKASAF